MFRKVSTTITLLLSVALSSHLHATKLTPEIEQEIASLNSIKEVNIEQFINLLDEAEDLIIVDSRTVKDRKGGFIEGSVSLPDTETTPETLKSIIPSYSQPVLFYCNGVKCGRSALAALIASKAGYSNIFWFKGGWETWVANDMPVAK